MKIIKRIKEPTPRIHKILGKIATTLSAISSTLLLGGYIDAFPKLKIACVIVSIIFGSQAIFHAQKTEKNEK